MAGESAGAGPGWLKAAFVAMIGLDVALAVAWATGHEGARWLGVPVTLVVTVVAFVVQWVAFVPAIRARSDRYFDLTGSLTFFGVTWLAVGLSGVSARGLLVAGCVTVWAARLGAFLFRRIRQDGHDGRMDALKTSPPRFFITWTLQGLWVSLTLAAALAVIVSVDRSPLGLLEALGALVWLGGFALEAVADHQKRVHRREHPGQFIATGLWAWSRHPNYFGEITLWVGVALIATATLQGSQWVALISPLFVILLLTKISGLPMLEQRSDERYGSDPAYLAYKQRTPILIPRPPRAR